MMRLDVEAVVAVITLWLLVVTCMPDFVDWSSRLAILRIAIVINAARVAYGSFPARLGMRAWIYLNATLCFAIGVYEAYNMAQDP